MALEPHAPDPYALLAQIMLVRKCYADALYAADEALATDPEHVLALNLRSAALIKLGRREESATAISGALREDPDNPWTHANYVWGLLEAGDHRAAAEHFGLALRREPGLDLARAGMVEALKAKNPLYRLYLRYAFFMSRLTANYQWGVIIGFYVLFRIQRGVAASQPALAPVINPLLVFLAVVARSTWTLGPVGDLLLRLDPHGRYLLNKREIRIADAVGIGLLLGLGGLLARAVSGNDAFLVMAGYGVTMILPLGLFDAATRTRHLLRYYAGALGLIGLLAVALAFVDRPFNVFTVIYLLGMFLVQWVANYQVIQDE